LSHISLKKKPIRDDSTFLALLAGDGEEGGGTGFTVLGEDLAKGRSKVRRVLPHWLANPDIVSVDLSDQQVAVNDLGGENI